MPRRPRTYRGKDFDELHAEGAQRFGWPWYKANEQVIDAFRECGFDPTEGGPECWDLALLATAGVKHDNRAENLLLTNNREHTRLHCAAMLEARWKTHARNSR